MKKILHIPNYYPPNKGGIEQATYDIVSVLKNDFEQKVICFNHAADGKTVCDVYDGIDIIRPGVIKKMFSQSISFSYRKELKKIIQEFEPDIIHFHLPNPLASVYLLSIGIPKTTKLILYWHADIVEQKLLGKIYKPIQNILLKRAYKINGTKKYLTSSQDVIPFLDKCFFVNYVVDEKKLQMNEQNKRNIQELKNKYKGYKLALFVGRHVEYKGLRYLIEAAKYIDKNTMIVIAGEGVLTPSLKEQAKELNTIIFLGRITDEELKEYLYASDVFLFPSITKNEAFGIAMMEALYCGIPAVCFDIEGSAVSYLNQDGITGFVVENKNVIKFAEAVNRITTDEELRNKLSRQAKDWINQHFNKQQLREKLLLLYS